MGKVVASGAFCFVAVALVVVPPCLSAATIVEPDILMVTQTTVSRWNLGSGTVAFSKSIASNGLGDMCRTNDGRYVAYEDTYGGGTLELLQIDPNTGASSVAVRPASGATDVVALTAMPDGELLGADNNLGFVRIDPNTLAYTLVPIHLYCGGMATSASGQIYAWGTGGGFSGLFMIDPIAGTAVEIGGRSGLYETAGLEAMAFSPDGSLFGFTDANGVEFASDAVYQINLQTGGTTLLEQSSNLQDVRGVAFVTPEPGTLALLAVGALAIAAYAWRRRRQSAWHAAGLHPRRRYFLIMR